MSAPVIHWFRQDLRLHDNAALSAAISSGRPVVPVFLFDDAAPERETPGGASRWWLHQSLSSLASSLRRFGSDLVLRRGAAPDVLSALIADTGATAVHMTRCYEPYAAAIERELSKKLTKIGVELRRFGGGLLVEPENIATREGRPYRVFTPFDKACLSQLSTASPVALPRAIPAPQSLPEGDLLEDWGLEPSTPDWAGGLRATWIPGEHGAESRLDSFLDNTLGDYEKLRDLPGKNGTSRLSPHLHFGEISPRQCWHQTVLAAEMGGQSDSGATAFLRELVWREFSYHLLYHFPALPEAPLRKDFERFPWQDDQELLTAWQRGQTGYPIVDAGMRELWHSRWMHNRVRMIVASFLVKDLLIPWQAGAAWFWDTLVDADLANNSASWQWVAGCGADAAPFFRIFNPVTQGRKFDPDGGYVRRWVPELADLPDKFIHEPWSAPESVLEGAGVVLGRDYPRPIVDHAAARRRALEAFQGMGL
jgi:deoxyribodipyrimidine photo-lyase